MKALPVLCLFALLSAADHSYAQDSDRGEAPVTYPTLPTINPQGFNWDYTKAPSSKPVTVTSALPTQIIDGQFNSSGGWQVFAVYRNNVTYSGLQYTLNFYGAALPAGRLNGNELPKLGLLSQPVRIGPKKQLVFDWKPTFGGGSIYGFMDVRITELTSGKVLLDQAGATLQYSTIAGDTNRQSKIDLTQFVGMDVNIQFSVSGPASESALDNVRIIDAPTYNYTGGGVPGQWFNPHRSGSGWDLRRAPDNSFYTIWFTYNEAGLPVWYISGAGQFSNGIFQAQLYKCARNGLSNSCPNVGRVKLSMHNPDSGYMEYDFNDINGGGTWDGTEYFRYLVGGQGGWFTPAYTADSGWGFTTTKYSQYNAPSVSYMFLPIYYYDGAGQATWAIANSENWVNNQVMSVMRQRGGLCPSCEGVYPTISQQNVGTVRLNFNVPDQSSVSGEFLLNNPAWTRPTQQYNKLTN